jgi:hypothetical protein
LASIAIPQFVAYRTRAFNTSANVAVRYAYTAAQSFFSVSPAGVVSVNILSVYGYNPDPNLILSVGGARLITNFTIQAVHNGGGSVFTIDQTGDVTRS